MIGDRLKFPSCFEDWDARHGCFVGAAIIGGIGSAFGASQAADAQTHAADKATATQWKMFNKASEYLKPFIQGGTDTMGVLKNFIDPNQGLMSTITKLVSPGADMNSTLEALPGYQFTRDQGLKSVGNALAARGLAGPGGSLARASADYTTGLAQNTWQNLLNGLLSSYQTGSTALQNLVNTGAGAASSLAGNATATGSQIAQNTIGAGNAQASMWNTIGGIGNNVGNAMMMNKLYGLYGGT